MYTFYRGYDNSIDYYQQGIHNTTNSDTTQDWGVVGNILVWGLITGTLLSYTPQYYKIFKNKSTKGISESTIVFGVYSCLLNVLGTIQQDYSRIRYCKQNNNCYNAWIPIVQLIAPLLCMIILYAFFLLYLSGNNNSNKKPNIIEFRRRNRVYSRSRLNLATCGIFVLITLIINTCLHSDKIVLCGKIFNTISAVLSILMWLPQILITYKLKSDHALSLIALSIHSIGCFITVFYQGIIMKQNFLVIGNYVIGGIAEGSIVCMVLYYRKQNNKYQVNDRIFFDDELSNNYISYENEVVTL
jgi:uncharacterized protein with PQ loop repeat